MNNQMKRSHNFKDITGQIFGMITVVDYSHTDGKVAKWNCVCSCGVARVVPGAALRSGNTRSCGHDRAKNMAHAETRHELFVECMGLAAKMPRQSDDDVHKIIDECDSVAFYTANSYAKAY